MLQSISPQPLYPFHPHRAFRDLMGWRPYGAPAAPLHELLCAEIFRLYEKRRRSKSAAAAAVNAADPSAVAAAAAGKPEEIGNDEVRV